MHHIVEAQFSGNAKLYGYLIPASMEAACEPGVRIVVINKMGEGGKPSLSIATIVNVATCGDEMASLLKPFVQVVSPLCLANAVAAQSVTGAAA